MKIGKTLGLVGDVHFGKNKGEEWYKSYEDLFSFIKSSYKGKTDTIMFAGDVFDGKKEKTTEKAITFRMMEFVSKLFDDLAKDFHVVIYAGNHCCYYKDRCDVSGLAMLKGRDNITIIEEPTDFSVGNKNYRIIPWGFNVVEKNDSVVDGIFTHIDIQTFKMDNGRESDHGYKTKDLFKVCDTVWTGHYHTRQDRTYQKGKKRVVYLGSPLQLSWGESGKESYIYLLDLEKNDIKEEFLNDFSPKFRKVNASLVVSDPERVKGDILTVIWDIENSEENQIKITDSLAKNKVLTFRNDYSNLSVQTDMNTSEIKTINDTVDVRQILDLHTDAMESEDKFKKLVNDKFREILDRVI